MNGGSQQGKSGKRKALEVTLIVVACLASLLLLSGCGCGGLTMGFKICKHCMIV